MRILANYGYKAGGESYCVTFETLSDLKGEEAGEAVDELFRMAKKAIQRQLDDGGSPMKGSEALITPKQRALIIRLAKERGEFIDGLNDMSMSTASEKIKELLTVEE